MMIWEYTTLMMGTTGLLGGHVDGEGLTSRLNELGAQGWELISIFDTNQMQGRTRDVVAILQRLAAPSADDTGPQHLR